MSEAQIEFLVSLLKLGGVEVYWRDPSTDQLVKVGNYIAEWLPPNATPGEIAEPVVTLANGKGYVVALWAGDFRQFLVFAPVAVVWPDAQHADPLPEKPSA